MIHNSSVSTSHAIHPPSHRNTFLKSLALGTRPLCRRRRRSGRVPTVDLSTRRLRAESVLMYCPVQEGSTKEESLYSPWAYALPPNSRERASGGPAALSPTRDAQNQKHNFGPHFGCLLASKMDAKSFQNASKKPTKNHMNFALKKSRKMDPIWGSRGGPTNQLFTPKIQSGTPWAPQGAPEGHQKVPWTIFDRFWNRFHDMLIVFQ